MADDIQPMPEGFAPDLVDDGKTMRYSVVLNCNDKPVRVSYGYIKDADAEMDAKRRADLVARIWTFLELARLGRTEELKHAAGIRQ